MKFVGTVWGLVVTQSLLSVESCTSRDPSRDMMDSGPTQLSVVLAGVRLNE